MKAVQAFLLQTIINNYVVSTVLYKNYVIDVNISLELVVLIVLVFLELVFL